MHRRSSVIALAAAAAVATACSDDAAPAADAAPEADAGPCGDEFFYQVEVFDWSSDLPVLQAPGAPTTVTLIDLDDPGESSTVAPNGRATLCLPATGTSRVEIDSDVHLTRVELVSRASYALFPGPALRVYLLEQEDLDGLAGATTAGTAHLFARPSVSDVTVAVDVDADVPLVGTPPGLFTPGDTTSPQASTVVIRNIPVGSGSVPIEVTGGGGCIAPASIAPMADTIIGVPIGCAE